MYISPLCTKLLIYIYIYIYTVFVRSRVQLMIDLKAHSAKQYTYITSSGKLHISMLIKHYASIDFKVKLHRIQYFYIRANV